MVFKYIETNRSIPTEIIIKKEKICDRNVAGETFGGSTEILGIEKRAIVIVYEGNT